MNRKQYEILHKEKCTVEAVDLDPKACDVRYVVSLSLTGKELLSLDAALDDRVLGGYIPVQPAKQIGLFLRLAATKSGIKLR